MTRAAPVSLWRTPLRMLAALSRKFDRSSSRPTLWMWWSPLGRTLFYTVTLPCTLWFLDKGKAKTPRADSVLFIDARHIYRQIDRAHREWTPAQIGFLANIVRLYRGEELDFTRGGDVPSVKLRA